MIVDTSALVAILYGEPEAQAFVERIHDADVCRISVATTVELSMVVESQLGADGMRQAEAFLRRAGVLVEPVTLEHGDLARQAFRDFGKGRHKAGLNFGDCFFLGARQGDRGSPCHDTSEREKLFCGISRGCRRERI